MIDYADRSWLLKTSLLDRYPVELIATVIVDVSVLLITVFGIVKLWGVL